MKKHIPKKHIPKKHIPKKHIPIILTIVIIIVVILCTSQIYAPGDADSQYFCNRKPFSLDMKVKIENMDGKELYTIDGEVFSAYEDDLKMTNTSGQTVLNTNDKYNFISQNQHDIYRSDELIYVCDGKIKWFADSYDVFNKDGDKIAYIKFNMWDTKGTMVDMDGNVIAKYNSAWSRYDYIVSIYENCPIDDESILMIFASYVSDVRSDSRN